MLYRFTRSQPKGRGFLATKIFQELGTNLKKKDQNSRKKEQTQEKGTKLKNGGTKLKKKDQHSRKSGQHFLDIQYISIVVDVQIEKLDWLAENLIH